jgi:hypothetical protein
MKGAKVAALLLIALVAAGSVIYQIVNRRPSQGVVAGSAPDSQRSAGGTPSPATAANPAGQTTAGNAEQNSGPAPDIPAAGWGRNPFLTPEEITRLNQPEVPVAAEAPPPKPEPQAPGLPAYNVTGIISGDQGRWAIVDGRLLRPGEQIGTETVKEITDGGIVLQHDGQMRVLPLKRIEDTLAAAPPKKEAK